MKKWIAFLGLYFCLCLALGGCGQTPSPAEGGTGSAASPPDSMFSSPEASSDSGSASDTFRIIRYQDGVLLLARQGGATAEVYTLTPEGGMEPAPDGAAPEEADRSWRPGALAEITWSAAEETFPARLCGVTAVRVLDSGFDDLCRLYSDVLEDLWTVDPGLNGGISELGVDLSRTGLSASEQAAVAWAFAGEHGISDSLTLSYEELAAEGYLAGTEPDSDGIPCWEDGCLFTIAEQETGDNELNGARNTVTFDAQKWRSALGAYFFADCTAEQALDGHWGDYTVGSEAIS